MAQYCFTTADKRTINKLLRNILLKNKQTLVSSKQHPTMTESGEPNDCMKEEAGQRSIRGGGGHCSPCYFSPSSLGWLRVC